MSALEFRFLSLCLSRRHVLAFAFLFERLFRVSVSLLFYSEG